MIVFLKVKCKDGKYEFTEEELRKLISDVEKEAYDSGYYTGYKDGTSASHSLTYDTQPPSPNTISPPYNPVITCSKEQENCCEGEQIPIDFNGIS